MQSTRRIARLLEQNASHLCPQFSKRESSQNVYQSQFLKIRRESSAFTQALFGWKLVVEEY